MMQIEAVVRRIKWLTSIDAMNKVLVFSTWQDVLEVVAHALRTNRLPFAHARGRKAMDSAISLFKAAKPQPLDDGQAKAKPAHLQTLLLLVKQGGNGLNLTGALVTSCSWLLCYVGLGLQVSLWFHLATHLHCRWNRQGPCSLHGHLYNGLTGRAIYEYLLVRTCLS